MAARQTPKQQFYNFINLFFLFDDYFTFEIKNNIYI